MIYVPEYSLSCEDARPDLPADVEVVTAGLLAVVAGPRTRVDGVRRHNVVLVLLGIAVILGGARGELGGKLE